MANLTKILGIPILAIATLLPVGCYVPVYPDFPHGTINVGFPQGPYSYKIDVTAWDGNLNHVNAIVGQLSPGRKTMSFELMPDTYFINAYGQDSNKDYHQSKENIILTIFDNGVYNIDLTMN